MKTHWLISNRNKKVILFFSGWGTDFHPFKPLASTLYDVLIVYDYSDPACEIDLEEALNLYDECILIGWSMGVCYAHRNFPDKSCFSTAIAVNGTLCPIDKRYGIDPEFAVKTLKAWSEASRKKFNRRMCKGKSVLERFNENGVNRTIENQANELRVIIEEGYCLDEAPNVFDRVLISDKDFIIPTLNQKRYWQESVVIDVVGGHFPFYNWQSWDEMIDFISDNQK